MLKRVAFVAYLKIYLIVKRNTKKCLFLLCVKINSDYILNPSE